MMPTRRFVKVNELWLHVLCWGELRERPPLVLVAGTGFPALTWRAVAEMLADQYAVYALDRRGHGLSDKPAPCPSGSGRGYDFVDFAADLIGMMEALEIRGAYGIGHSAGGTDVLLAAGQRPDLFTRVLAIEPTICHARAPLPSPPPCGIDYEAAARKRRGIFESRAVVFARYGSRPPFNAWRASSLWDYVQDGFEDLPDGRVRLRCAPELEAEMIVAINSVIMWNRIAAGLADPFPVIERICCPVRLITGGLSAAPYRRMAETTTRVVAGSTHHHLPHATHYLPMQLPEELARLVRAFACGKD